MSKWLRDEDTENPMPQLPNIVLTPLVVLTQLAQFSQYLSRNLASASTQESDPLRFLGQDNIETSGLCTGLLAASAVSSSTDTESFHRHGAVAIRLAMVIGALVDAQDSSDTLHGRSKSFAVAWGTQDMAKELVGVLDCFPEAYLSVLFDEKRATITTAERTSTLLVQKLKQKGVTIAEVGLLGRFHSQCHHEDLEELLRFCDSRRALQFPEISMLNTSIYLSADKQAPEAKLHHLILRMILVEQSAWYTTLSLL
ncbi:hypothetical protein GGR56DRAFT_661299 [Xylariaceae sp. FL0804]|nr:hypothetical protein GGR56DRAFT_661299 [Xylariaceae sp. FL0804]